MFEIELTESAVEDLHFLRKADRRHIVAEIERHLSVEPLVPTLRRKPLRPNLLAPWELRIGDFRVFYDVEEGARIVMIRAVGWKEHNRLLIRGKEFLL
ncbi:MAG TPA: type II toxin-antitoxin system RelE/ParE family toxin [Thermoanaerobaculia bacterium]|nr:type II toxin-antitoxin system RelE/ParE family toxin [Thermoanaerobaculia bacterium]